ncbi:hypothetical protein [Janthinobacterium sp.]|uniref:hypothetical protein n=1 Tax=Janthinobacterium sp. TaxID=1871054 RepID=UPI002617BEAB|nr:hypothetical protein [Janthinobacterium sp.]
MGATRLPSRQMAQNAKRPIIPLKVFLIVVAVGFGYFIYASSARILGVTGTLICVFYVWTIVLNRREKHRLQTLACAREGESICHFARSFDKRKTDTWIIRAAHQELQVFLRPFVAFPVRASDSLTGDLGLDVDDVEDLIVDVALRAGRSLEQTERNPYYGKVRTVSEVVLFVNAQPSV